MTVYVLFAWNDANPKFVSAICNTMHAARREGSKVAARGWKTSIEIWSVTE